MLISKNTGTKTMIQQSCPDLRTQQYTTTSVSGYTGVTIHKMEQPNMDRVVMLRSKDNMTRDNDTIIHTNQIFLQDSEAWIQQ